MPVREINMASDNPFTSKLFDDEAVPLSLLREMGRAQSANFDEFIVAMQVACESVQGSASSSGMQRASSPPVHPPPLPPRASVHDPVADGVLRSLRMEIPTFCGRQDSRSPEEFLLQLQRYARASRKDVQWILCELIPVTLVDDALRWWLSCGEFEYFETFRASFLRAFGVPDRLRRLRMELDARTQHPDEDFAAYVRIIGEFYGRIGAPASQAEQIDRVLAQATPFSRQQLQGRFFSTMRELAEVGPELQETVWRNATYRPPPLPAYSLERDLAFVGPVDTQTHAQPSTPLPFATHNSVAIYSGPCSRCHQSGHWAQNCPSLAVVPVAAPAVKALTPAPTSGCHRCGGTGHWARQCSLPRQTAAPNHQPTTTGGDNQPGNGRL